MCIHLIIPMSIENSPKPITGRIAMIKEINHMICTKRKEKIVD